MEIDAKRTIFIAIDGTKTDTTSGGGWLISTTTGKLTAHGGKPIFGNNDSMHLHRSEIYVALALFTFLSEYCKYYQITNNSVNVLYCDNEEVVKKLKAIIKNKQTYLHEYRMSEHEAILDLIPILTTTLHVRHIKSHRDKVKGKENLNLPEHLNSIADDLANTYATTPKQCHIQSTLVAVYYNESYLANDYQNKLRSITHFHQAKQYIKNKYNWSEKTFNDIEWNLHHKRIRQPGRHSIIVKLKYIHQLLPSGKMNFDIPHKCRYCNKTESTTTPHDHFLQCSQSNIIKTKRLSLIENILLNTFTPQSLINIIIQGLSSYYNGQDTMDTSHLLNNDLYITQHQNAIGWDNLARGIINHFLERDN